MISTNLKSNLTNCWLIELAEGIRLKCNVFNLKVAFFYSKHEWGNKRKVTCLSISTSKYSFFLDGAGYTPSKKKDYYAAEQAIKSW